MARPVVIGVVCAIVVLLAAVLFCIWHRPTGGAQPGAANANASYLSPELRAVQKRSHEIAQKERDPSTLNAQDWADVRAMTANVDWRIRAYGLSKLSMFKGTRYEEEAWKTALEFLCGKDRVDRAYACDAVARLRPAEAPRYIAPLLEDPNPKVRKNAEDLLTRLGYSRRKG